MCHEGTNARSFNLAQKVLTLSNSILVDAISCFIVYFSSCACIQSELTSGVKDVTFVLTYMIYNYMLRMAFLIEFAGAFKDKRR